ncbi:hypothetical protein DY000_02033737 [Brassica cretica]|uniref:FBD domain-containing protein n=1 Tax=Brassica cretica TaxID=69181 RepID=A0ABQ7DXL4_BRACR|nr:hypothetical protein DY000_02033737 [Brassica cretica]
MRFFTTLVPFSLQRKLLSLLFSHNGGVLSSPSYQTFTSVAHLNVQEDVSRISRIEYWLYLSALASGHSHSNVNMSLGMKTLSTVVSVSWEWFSYDETDEENIRVDSRCLTHEFDNVSFDTPALTYLEYSDYVPKEYLIVNLNSLVEANLNLWVDEEGVWRPYHATTFYPMTMINRLKNVGILSLTSEAVEIFDVLNESIPMFVMVSQLSLALSERCWFSLTNVIKKFPNLKTLIIEGSVHYDYSEYSCLLSCPVEVLKINEYYGSVNELEQMKHFLGKLPCLGLVEVCARATSSEAKLQIMADLLMIPRASSKCKIQLSLALSERCWFSLTNVIKKFPNLKTLIIEGSVHYDYSEYSCLLSCPVEVLKINEYYGSVNELEQMKHFLGKLPCLGLVEVCARATSSEAKLQIMADLLMIPRASSKCKIQVKFFPKS